MVWDSGTELCVHCSGEILVAEVWAIDVTVKETWVNPCLLIGMGMKKKYRNWQLSPGALSGFSVNGWRGWELAMCSYRMLPCSRLGTKRTVPCWHSEDTEAHSAWSVEVFFTGCSKVFLESTGREPLLRGSRAPSDHIAQLLPSCAISAGWGALVPSVKQMHSFKPPSDWWAWSLISASTRRPPLILPAAISQRPGAQTMLTEGAASHSHLRQTAHLSYWLKYTPPAWGREEGVLITGCSSPRN